MKLLNNGKGHRALTLVDVLIAVATIALTATFLVFAGRPRHRGPCGISCANNLRQIGLAFRMWGNDHGDKFPWQVAAKDDGTLEFSNSSQVWRHFAIASNELNSPKILACPYDAQRSKTNIWAPNISNQNISYFIGLDADETKPQTIVSGDRNLSTNTFIFSGAVTFPSAANVRWTSVIHTNMGNIGFGDGSVMQVSSRQIFQCVTNAGLPLRLSIP